MRIVPITTSVFLKRVIGSTDFKGQGTIHPLVDCNPFVFLEDVPVINSPHVPKFGMHPHSGVMILTVCLTGYMENVMIDRNGEKQTSVHGPGPFLLAVDSGRGLVHDEHTAKEAPTKILQLAWTTGDDSSEAQFFNDEDPLILREDNGAEVMLCAGKFGKRKARITQNCPTVLCVTLPAGISFETDELTSGNGFLYSIEHQCGPLSVNGLHVPHGHAVDFEHHSGPLKVKNESDNVVSVLIGYGEPLQSKWTKLLMHDGFIFAKTEEDAEKKREEFRLLGANRFGRLPQ